MDQLWTMMRSTDMANFNQACALLEGLLEGDEDLRRTLITNTECEMWMHSFPFTATDGGWCCS